LGRFIVDFVCFEMRLVIEVDGPSHLPKESEAHDSRRDAWLASQGFRILRLPNDLVIGSTEPAIERIRTALTSNIRPDLR
jgi:very-short-patch-repair endonuclease